MCFHKHILFFLFLANENINRCTREMPLVAHLVFQETLVRFLHVLWLVCKEHKRWRLSVRQLRTILNLDVLTLG